MCSSLVLHYGCFEIEKKKKTNKQTNSSANHKGLRKVGLQGLALDALSEKRITPHKGVIRAPNI